MSKNSPSNQSTTARAIKAVLYARISVDKLKETSIKNQTREMRQWCKSMGWAIAGEFHDRGKSAFKLDTEREGFDAALAMIESGAANHLVVWKLDRMTRNARGWVEINRRLESADATFASKSEQWLDTSNVMGYAIVGLFVALAQMEAENVQDRIRSWQTGRRTDKMVPTGNPPYGYLKPSPNVLEVHKVEGPNVQDMAARILKGESLNAIARQLNASGIPTRQGKPWHPTTVRGILTNPTVAALDRNGTDCASDSWERLLEVETFNRVGALIEGKNNQRGIVRREWMMTSLMTCNRCNGNMMTKSHHQGMRYRCVGCANGILASIADEYVGRWILETTTAAQWQSLRTQGKGSDPRVIESIEQRIEEVMMDYATNPRRFPADRYGRMMDALESQLAAATSEPSIPLPNVEDLHAAWPSMSVADKRLVIAARSESIKVAPHATGVTKDARIAITDKADAASIAA